MRPTLHDAPAGIFKDLAFLAITLSIPAELGSPELTICAGQRMSAFGAPMPETAVDEDGQPPPREDDVRADARNTYVGPIAADPRPPKRRAQPQLRARIPTAIPEHDRARRQRRWRGIARVSGPKGFDSSSLGTLLPLDLQVLDD